MKKKIAELEEVRISVEKLNPKAENFIKDLLQLLDRTTSQLSEVDDQQEITWTAKSFEIAMQIKNDKVEKELDNKKDLALTYLKEAIDSVIMREQKYLK